MLTATTVSESPPEPSLSAPPSLALAAIPGVSALELHFLEAIPEVALRSALTKPLPISNSFPVTPRTISVLVLSAFGLQLGTLRQPRLRRHHISTRVQ